MTTMRFGDGKLWTKSSRSGGANGSCVYIRREGDRVCIRDSKDGLDGPILECSADEFTALFGTRR